MGARIATSGVPVHSLRQSFQPSRAFRQDDIIVEDENAISGSQLEGQVATSRGPQVPRCSNKQDLFKASLIGGNPILKDLELICSRAVVDEDQLDPPALTGKGSQFLHYIDSQCSLINV